MTQNDQKKSAAEAALPYVKSGMVLGLGSGSTAEIFIALLGVQVKQGLDVAGVPTSENTAEAACRAGVTLVSPEDVTRIDLAIDGTDEVDRQFRLIKGGGGCLLREKIVAASAQSMIVIADGSKLVEQLGAFPLPVEIDRFGVSLTAHKVAAALRRSGCKAEPRLRLQGDTHAPFITDGGNYILDCPCGVIPEPELTARLLSETPGVVEHGLFLDLARTIILGRAGGAEFLEMP